MKIVFINSVYDYGSTGHIVKALNEHQDDSWEKYAFYGRKNKHVKEAVYIGNHISFILSVIKSYLFDSHGFSNKYNTKEIIKQLDTINPDVVNIHNVHGFYLNIDLLLNYLKEKNIITILTLHDCWTFTGFCSYFDALKCDKWQNQCIKCNLCNQYPFRLLPMNTNKNFYKKKMLFDAMENLAIVAPSKWMDDNVDNSFLKKHRHLVINNGVDLKSFYFDEHAVEPLKEKYKISNKRILLGVASVWDKRKGLTDFIELNELLSDEQIIVLIGINAWQRRRLPKSIICIRRTESIDELRAFYSAAHCLINMTYQDNFPTVNIEALACGLPVITYDTGGSAEIVGECGIVCQRGNVNEVMSAVEKLDRDIYTKEQCIKRARERFSDLIMTDNYYHLYSSLIKNN